MLFHLSQHSVHPLCSSDSTYFSCHGPPLPGYRTSYLSLRSPLIVHLLAPALSSQGLLHSHPPPTLTFSVSLQSPPVAPSWFYFPTVWIESSTEDRPFLLSGLSTRSSCPRRRRAPCCSRFSALWGSSPHCTYLEYF